MVKSISKDLVDTISLPPLKKMREDGGDVAVGVLPLKALHLLSDSLHLLSVAIEQSRLGTFYPLPPQLLPYLLWP